MKKLKTLLATALLATVTSTLIYADSPEQQFQRGAEAADKGDWHKAFKLWKPLAEQGDADAQYNLGWMYANRKGVEHDYQQAFKWYQKAAEQGHAQAQHLLGFSYALGHGVKKDRSKAKMWFKKACDNGYQKSCSTYHQFIVN